MKLNIAVEIDAIGRETVVITDDRGERMPCVIGAQIQTRQNERSVVTIELLVDRERVTLGRAPDRPARKDATAMVARPVLVIDHAGSPSPTKEG